MLLNDPTWVLESLSCYIVFIEPIGINIFLLILGIWSLWGQPKPALDLKSSEGWWMVFVSPTILFVFFLITVFNINIPLNLFDMIIILVLLPTILILGEAIEISRKNGLSIGAIIQKNWVGALIGLLVFLILLGLASNIYIENSQLFGSAYTDMRWAYYYSESKSIYTMWAFGFIFPLINLSFQIGMLCLLGFIALALFPLNGIIWQQGQKIFAALISIHIFVLYVALPIVVAVSYAGI